MNTEIIVAATALLGTILGASIPSIVGIADRRLNQKNGRKEKYENVIRTVLSEYFPRVEGCFHIAKNYEPGTRREDISFELEIMSEIFTIYEERLINELPLDILEEMADLNFSLALIRTRINMDLDNYVDLDTNFKTDAESAEIKFEELKEKVKKTYI